MKNNTDHSQAPATRYTFFMPSEKWRPPYELSQDEAHHACRVLRLHQGDKVRILDGEGNEALCAIASITKPAAAKAAVGLTVLEHTYHERASKGLILATAWTKAARKSFLLEKAVEFDATAIWFWQAEHSQFPVPENAKDAWHTQLIAGLKQCHNPWLPSLRTCPQGIEELIQAAHAIQNKHFFLEASHHQVPTLDVTHLAKSGKTICVIGPEGGFAAHEIEALREAGYTALSLGDRVLRWESAAVLCLGLHYWQNIPAQTV